MRRAGPGPRGTTRASAGGRADPPPRRRRSALFREGLTRPGELARFFDEQREWARRALEERAAETRGQGVPTLVRVVTGAPHQEIVETAKREGAGLIVMGIHGRAALERFFLGSVADRVIRASPCPVVTKRETHH